MAKASNNDFPSILMTEQAVKPSAPAAGKWRIYPKTDHKFYWEDSGGTETEIGGGGAGDMLWATIQASQLVNEVKGFPANVANDADLDTLNLWWDSVGTPTTKVNFVDVAGEGGVTESFEYCLKCVTDAASEGFYQRYTYADEPRVKSGRVVSALLAIWSVSSLSVTAKLVNSDASETAASAVTAAAWTIVEVPNHTLAGTYCDLQITAGAAGTFYVVPLGLCIGAKAVPLGPRPTRWVDKLTDTVVNGADPGGSWTDVDVTAGTSNLAFLVELICVYKNTTTTESVCVRRNGDTTAVAWGNTLCRNVDITNFWSGSGLCMLDDGQIFEYIGGAAGSAETVYISIRRFQEWG